MGPKNFRRVQPTTAASCRHTTCPVTRRSRKKKKAKDPAASVGTSNLSGEVNVYNTCNLLSGGKIDGFIDTAGGLQRSHLVQRKASHRSIFG